ncbi:MAG: aspartate kinase [Bacteroidota bacterium]|nr:aspartate kinase [Bacteroidota bacterium]
MQVFKFGGASVKDADSVKNVSEILKKYVTEPTIVVVSAMGKTTNKLEELVNAYFYKEGDATLIIEELKTFHLNIVSQLFENIKSNIYAEVENVFTEISWCIEDELTPNYSFHYDQIVSNGEVLATKIISAYLNSIEIKNTWIDARGIVQTDNSYREGKVNYELSEALVQTQLLPLFKNGNLVITQGFIGGTSENYCTTLGREGSDYTAALLAYFTNTRSVTIWKDVAGVLNADPKYFKNTKKIDELTYHDAIELTYYGASVIHPKTIKPLQNKNIPLFVKSFLKPEDKGTIITNGEKRSNITTYIFKVNQVLLSIQPIDFSFIAEENLSVIFSLFTKYNVHANMTQNSAISFSVCLDYDVHKIEPLIADLQKQFKVLYNNTNVELMTVRNYNDDILKYLTENKTVLIEQRSRNTLQMVMISLEN